jgi:hypothetical protein
MFIPITAATLALLTAMMLLIGIFWSRFPSPLRSFLFRVSVLMIVIHLAFVATKWDTTSNRLNVLINWFAIAGYELLLFRFSRLSPRWLTLPSAIILLIPLFASSILLPLTSFFMTGRASPVSLDKHFFYEVNPWRNAGGGNAGVDVKIYYRSPFIPFLRHKVRTIPFNNQECNSYAATAAVFPDKKIVVGRCTNWPSQPSTTLEKVFSLP